MTRHPQPGETWRTRIGCAASVLKRSVVQDARPLIGLVMGRTVLWTEDGFYNEDKEPHHLDLVAIWDEPADLTITITTAYRATSGEHEGLGSTETEAVERLLQAMGRG